MLKKITTCSMLFLFICFAKLECKPLVYDCFLFLNEYEILDIRLHEMNDVVDKFVIVESSETFRGNPKPFNYAQNAARYASFSNKIIYIAIEDRLKSDDPWARETYQRNQIMRGLIGCKDDDIILISDVDEIIEKKGVANICSALKGDQKIVGAEQRYHSNLLNSQPGGPWRGTVAAKFALVKKHQPQGLRGMKDTVPAVAKGWHFTWQGGVDYDLYKLGAYSHAESDTPEERQNKINGGKTVHLCPVIPIDETFPQYIIDNQDYFESIHYIRRPQCLQNADTSQGTNQ